MASVYAKAGEATEVLENGLEIPKVGIVYKINAGLVPDLQEPELLPVYGSNNGFEGSEYIAPIVPKDALTIHSLFLGKDPLSIAGSSLL
jgi:hypothetical protein